MFILVEKVHSCRINGKVKFQQDLFCQYNKQTVHIYPDPVVKARTDIFRHHHQLLIGGGGKEMFEMFRKTRKDSDF